MTLNTRARSQVIDISLADSFEVSATKASIMRSVDENNSDNVENDDDFEIIILEKKSTLILEIADKTKKTSAALKFEITIENVLTKSMLIARLKQMSELSAKKISNAMKDERNKIIKNSDTYKSKKQIELDYFLRRCNQNFEIRSVIYRLDLDRVLYAQQFLVEEFFDVWCRKRERLSSEIITWELFAFILQEHIVSQRIRMLNVSKKLRDCRQRLKQTMTQLIAYIDSLENQLFFMSSKYVRVNQLLFFLHDHIQVVIIRKQESCNTRLEVEKTALLIERTEKNLMMSNQFRRENRIHKRSTSMTLVTSAQRSRRAFDDFRKFEFFAVNRESQITTRNRYQSTQAPRKSSASVSHVSRVSICWDCDKMSHIRSQCTVVTRQKNVNDR
jgi:hypothetical protein